MKVVILAGGFGTRLAEETHLRPKPMVEIGGIPMLIHIMNLYAAHGFLDFLVACGYRADIIKGYFSAFLSNHSDWIINLRDGTRTSLSNETPPWTVGVIDTGLHTMTGGRIRRLGSWLRDQAFLVTYGDGVADLDLGRLLAFHRAHRKLATVTAVRPPARFGSLELAGDAVRRFAEKAQASEGWINGGFFVFEPGVLDYLVDDQTVLERDPLEALAKDGELMAFRHEGFWQPMDTARDRQYLEQLWASGNAPWAPKGQAPAAAAPAPRKGRPRAGPARASGALSPRPPRPASGGR